MTDATATLAQRLSARLADKIAAVHEWEGETTLDVLPENWLAIGRALHDSDEFHFEQLIDLPILGKPYGFAIDHLWIEVRGLMGSHKDVG